MAGKINNDIIDENTSELELKKVNSFTYLMYEVNSSPSNIEKD